MTTDTPTRLMFLGVVCSLFAGSAAIGWADTTPTDFTLPDQMRECEGLFQQTCGIWTFDGKVGSGQWQVGAVADLLVQQSDPGRIIIHRSDSKGPSPGLTAIYVGKLSGHRIEGKVTWTWPGHWNRQIEGKWSATWEEPAPRKAPPTRQTPSPLPAPVQEGHPERELHPQIQPPASSLQASEQPSQDEVCASPITRRAMSSLEEQAIKDPNGAALSLIAALSTEFAYPATVAGGEGPPR